MVDNGSTDGTGEIAREAGVTVCFEPRRGYGFACAAGAAAAAGEILVFMDGDSSFVPSELTFLAEPILRQEADLALGARLLDQLPEGAMPPHQRFGNRLVSRLLNVLYGVHVTDLGPFRAISKSLFDRLDLREYTFGWTVEMMVRVARKHLRIVEIPVTYRPRLGGRSKIGGTLRGTILATYHIFRVVLRN